MKKIMLAVMLFAVAVPSFSQVYVSGKLVGAQQVIDGDNLSCGSFGCDGYNAKAKDINLGTKIAVGVADMTDIKIIKNIRAEIEYGYYVKSTTDTTDGGWPLKEWTGSTSINTFMLNAYYDFHNSSRFTPYIGGGLGFAQVKISDIDSSWGAPIQNSSNTNFAWNIGTGVGYSITNNIILDLGIKYNNFGKASGTIDHGVDMFGTHIFTTDTFSYSNMEMAVGIRYMF